MIAVDPPHDPLMIVQFEEVVVDGGREMLDYKRGDYYELYQTIKYLARAAVYNTVSVNEAADIFFSIV